jgi:thiosulfate/3-mercaptopyruvate sulfurtransferase
MLFLGNLQADLDRIADPSSSLPHMLPSERQFAAAADALGITPDDALVVYDNAGIFSSARVWWTWRVFGHPRCARRRGLPPAGGAQAAPAVSCALAPQASQAR